MTFPSFMTRMRSEFLIVDRRCAITNDVRPRASLSRPSWMVFSVLVSTELVASSSISIGESSTIARAMTSCCLCPADRSATSSSTVSYPSGRDAMNRSMPTASQASRMRSSVTPFLLYTMFSLMLPSKSQASWRTMQNWSWTFARSSCRWGRRR